MTNSKSFLALPPLPNGQVTFSMSATDEYTIPVKKSDMSSNINL